MAKRAYKIPATLSDNYMQMEIALQTKDGVGLKPLPIRVILIWLLGIFALVFFEFNEASVIPLGGGLMQIAFAIVWCLLIYIMTIVDRSHRMQLEYLPTILNYVQHSNRHVLTRRSSKAGPFLGIVGIQDIDEKTGLVTYLDGSYGYWFSVVGTASVLLFPEDRDAILDRVDDFYKKIGCDCEVGFMTARSAQKVTKQQAHLIAQYKALTYKDPDIDALVNEQYETLTKFVGKEFRSIKQYMYIKGDNREALSGINTIVNTECNGSGLMFRQCVPMYREDIEEALRLVYAEGDQ